MKSAVLLFLGFGRLTLGVHLPPEIETCKISDPNFQKCLISSAEKAFIVLANGNKDLGLPKLDPLYLDTVVIEPQPGPINIYQKYTDILLKGMSTGKVNDFGINLNDCAIWLNHTITVYASANYEIRGQLLLLPLNAKGNMSSKADGFEVYIKATCEKFKKGKADYIRVVSNSVGFKAKKIQFDFGVLINGNLQLDKDLHKIIDDNLAEFFEVMRPTSEALWSAAIFKMMNAVFTQIPLHELFED